MWFSKHSMRTGHGPCSLSRRTNCLEPPLRLLVCFAYLVSELITLNEGAEMERVARGVRCLVAAICFAGGGMGVGYAADEPSAAETDPVNPIEYSTRLKPEMLDGVTGGWWFNLGPTGARGSIESVNPRAFRIRYIFPGSPASGKLKVGDWVVGANGKKFQEADQLRIRGAAGYYGPRMELGKAIEESEGDPKLGGKLTFMVQRGGGPIKVAVQLKQIGYFSKDYPYNCKKSEILIKQACEFLVSNGWRGHHDTAVACKLALLAQGDTYIEYLRPHLNKMQKGYAWTWSAGMNTVLEAEWYLRTGDRAMLAHLKDEDRVLTELQYPLGALKFGKDWSGCFAHHGYDPVTEGYGVMATPTALAALGWAMMKRCGVDINEEAYAMSRGAINFSTKDSGAIGYGLKGDRPSSYTYSPTPFSPSAGKGEKARLCAATAVATLMHYIDPADEASENYYRRGVVFIGNSRDRFFDGHASGNIHALWSMIAGSLGPVVGEDDSYRELMDYYRYWFNVNRCHDGSFYWSPVTDSQVDPFKDLRYEITGTAILALSAPKRHLYIMGKDPLLPGIDLSQLSSKARVAYDAIKQGRFKTGLLAVESLKKSATGPELTGLTGLETYALKAVDKDVEALKAPYKLKDLYKVNLGLSDADKKYGGVSLYEDRVATYRQAVTSSAGVEMVAIGDRYYKVIAMTSGQQDVPRKKGEVLQGIKTFVGAHGTTPYGSFAQDFSQDMLRELSALTGEITSLLDKGDVFLATQSIVAADKEYAMYTTYSAKMKPLKAGLTTPESATLRKIGMQFHSIVAVAQQANPPEKGKTLQALKTFVGSYGDTAYGTIARDYSQVMLRELTARLNEIKGLIDTDPFLAVRKVKASNAEYAGYSTYKTRLEPLKTALTTPEATTLREVGASYYRVIDSMQLRRPPSKGDVLQGLSRFRVTHAGTSYGPMAKKDLAGMVAELDRLLAALFAQFSEGDVYMAGQGLLAADREYRQYSGYSTKASRLRAALATVDSRKENVIGMNFYHLADQAKRRPGSSIKKQLEDFAGKNKTSYYGGRAAKAAAKSFDLPK